MQVSNDTNKDKTIAPDFTRSQVLRLHQRIKQIRKKWTKKIDQELSYGNENNSNFSNKIREKKILSVNTQGIKENSSKAMGENEIVYYKKKKFVMPPPHEIKEADVEEFIPTKKVKKRGTNGWKTDDTETDTSVKLIYCKNKKRGGTGKIQKDIYVKNSEKPNAKNAPIKRKSLSNEGTPQRENVSHNTKNTGRISQSDSTRKEEEIDSNREGAIEDFLKHVSLNQSLKNNLPMVRGPEQHKKNYTVHNHESAEILEIENTISTFKNSVGKTEDKDLNSLIDKWFDKDFKERGKERKRRKERSLVMPVTINSLKKMKHKRQNSASLEDELLFSGDHRLTSTPKSVTDFKEEEKRKTSLTLDALDVSPVKKVDGTLERDHSSGKKRKSNENNGNKIDSSKKKKFNYDNDRNNRDLLKKKKSSNRDGKNSSNVSKDTQIKENVMVVKKINGPSVKKKTPENMVNNDKLQKKSPERAEMFPDLIRQLKEQYGMKGLIKILKNLSNSSTNETQSQKSAKSKSTNKSLESAEQVIQTIMLSDSERSKSTRNSTKITNKTRAQKGKHRAKELETIISSDEEPRNKNLTTEKLLGDIETVVLSSDIEERNATDNNLIKALKKRQKSRDSKQDKGIAEQIKEKSVQGKRNQNSRNGDNSDLNVFGKKYTTYETMIPKLKKNKKSRNSIEYKNKNVSGDVNTVEEIISNKVKPVTAKNVSNDISETIEIMNENDGGVIAVVDEEDKMLMNKKKIFVKENIVICTPEKANQSGNLKKLQQNINSTGAAEGETRISENFNSEELESTTNVDVESREWEKNNISDNNTLLISGYVNLTLDECEEINDSAKINLENREKERRNIAESCDQNGNKNESENVTTESREKEKNTIAKNLNSIFFEENKSVAFQKPSKTQNIDNSKNCNSAESIIKSKENKISRNLNSNFVRKAQENETSEVIDLESGELINSTHAARIEENRRASTDSWEENRRASTDNWEFLTPKIDKFYNFEYSRNEEATWIKRSPVSIKCELNSDLEFSPTAVKLESDDDFEMFDEETVHASSPSRRTDFENVGGVPNNVTEDDVVEVDFERVGGASDVTEDDVVEVIEEIVFKEKSVGMKGDYSPDLFVSQCDLDNIKAQIDDGSQDFVLNSALQQKMFTKNLEVILPPKTEKSDSSIRNQMKKSSC